MSPRGLVVFDCDGVLVDSEGISMRELTRAIRALGVAIDEEEARAAFLGASLTAVEEGVATRLGRPVPVGWMEDFLTVRAAAFERELRPVPGAAEAIEGVRALGWEVCVASQGRPEKMAQTLRVTGLRDRLPADRIFSATMVQRGKPAPDLYLHAAEVCGFAPAACVVVEDSVTGVTAALAAGMRVLGYAERDGAPLAALGAELVLDMREVPARVGRAGA